MTGPRVLVADNAGPFTLGGTRTFVLGDRRVAIIDPGPDDPSHLARVAERVADAGEGTILLTHGHPDHAGGARSLAGLTGFPVAGNTPGVDRSLASGDRISLDEGEVEVVDTPGHARRHLSYLHRPSRELYVGDLLLGEGDTSWVGEYPGCVADYMASLDRVEALAPVRIHPAHGPPLDDPAGAVARFREHRRERIRQASRALTDLGAPPGRPLPPGTDPDRLVEAVTKQVYGGELPAGVRVAAQWSVRALLEYLEVLPFPPQGAPTEEGSRLAGGS